jgi:hypothetical protein
MQEKVASRCSPSVCPQFGGLLMAITHHAWHPRVPEADWESPPDRPFGHLLPRGENTPVDAMAGSFRLSRRCQAVILAPTGREMG